MTTQDYGPRVVLADDATEGIQHDGAAALKMDIGGLTVAAIDGSADYVVFWDATDSKHKRALASTLGGGGGISDGDKGDITVSGSGTVWTIDADTIVAIIATHTGAENPHPQYALAAEAEEFIKTDGTRDFTAAVSGVYTPTSTFHLTPKTYVDTELANAALTAAGAFVAKADYTAADRYLYGTGAGAYTQGTITSLGRSIVAETDRIEIARTLGVPVCIQQDHGANSASNTALEVTVATHTFAAGFLGDDDGVNWVICGWLRNNTGTNRWLFPRLKWGGLQVHSDFTANLSSSSTAWRPWRYEIRLRNMNDQATQSIHGTFSLGAAGDATPGEGDFATGNDYYTLVMPEDGVHRSVDTASAATLAVTFQMQGAASTNLAWECDFADLTLIPAI